MARSTVSVICAPPNGRNAGMASVDLAFADMATRFPNLDVTYWRLWDASEWIDPQGVSQRRGPGAFFDPDTGLVYRILRNRLNEALGADRVIFWGDFLHMGVYLDQTADVLHRRMGAATSHEEALRMATETYLLPTAEQSVLDRTLSFGTTLSMNTPTHYASAYGDQLRHFHRRMSHVWHRDPYSAQVARFSRVDGSVCQGPDAAFLLDEPYTGPRRPSAKIFFGRSNARPEVLATFGRSLTRRLRYNPECLQWGEEPAFWPMSGRRRFRAAWPELELGPAARWQDRVEFYRVLSRPGRGTSMVGAPSPNQLFEEICNASLVITDTYHLAVNAWRLGTPAVMVVDGPSGEWNVNAGEPGSRRDKRVDLYSQLDALDLTVNVDDLRWSSRSEAERVARSLTNRQNIAHTLTRVTAMREIGRSAVSEVLSRIG